MSSPSVRIDPGTVVGPYLVQRKLAQGGMSVLYVAHDPSLDREVVLKVLPDELATPAARVRLMREARALASVEHPGIVRVYGTGDHEGTPWIAMEYVRGTDLKRILSERGPVSTTRALRWVVQVADALSAAHDAGVIHRDLKPSNILLAASSAAAVDELIKVVDFGIAKRRVEASGDVLTSRREVLGTPAYLSPEQLEHGLADERSDVWALGCVLYELTIGAPPFGRSGSASTMASILRDEPEIPSHIGSATRSIIMACLRKSSFARVGSPRELAALARDALGAASAGERGERSERVAHEPSGPPYDRLSERPARASRPSFSSIAVPDSRSAPFEPTSQQSTRGSTRPSTRPSARPGSGWPDPSSSSIRTALPLSATSAPPLRAQPTSTSSLRAAAASRGRIKGTAIRAGLAWFANAYGIASIGRVVERGSPELRGMLRENEPAFGIIASGWYDAMSVGELLELMETVADPDDSDEYTNALTTAIARDNVSGIYRSLFKLISSAELLEANVQRVWSTYCDEGTFTATPLRPGEIAFALKGVARHHAKLCSVVGFSIQNVLRAVGFAAMVIERTQCVADGHGFCAYEGVYLP